MFLSTVLTGPYSSVLPFAFLPPISRFLTERVMKLVERISPKPEWLAVFAGVGACTPGVVVLSLLSFSTYYIPRLSPADFGCYVKIYGPLSVVLLLVARATISLLIRSYRVRQLLALTSGPSERLGRIAAEVGVRALELGGTVPICATVGVFAPRVILSSVTLAAFSDEELRAALLHERAHVIGRHTPLKTVVAFLSECGLWRAHNAVALFGQACEELADEAAAREIGPLVLSSTLVRFARVSWTPPYAEGFANADGLDRRVRHLLQPVSHESQYSGHLAVTAALALTSSLAAYPHFARLIASSLFNCLP